MKSLNNSFHETEMYIHHKEITIWNSSFYMQKFHSMIAKLEISVERKYLRGIFRNIDLDKSGAVEFDEFYTFATK